MVKLDGTNFASYDVVPPVVIEVVTGPTTSPKFTFLANSNVGSVDFTFNCD